MTDEKLDELIYSAWKDYFVKIMGTQIGPPEPDSKFIDGFKAGLKCVVSERETNIITEWLKSIGECENKIFAKWLDSRFVDPPCNSFNTYFVTFIYERRVLIGFADWTPTDNYTSGFWTNIRTTNGNKLDGQVLCWTKHPSIPIFQF